MGTEQIAFDFYEQPVSPLLVGLRRTLDVLEKFQLDICAALEYGNNSHTFDDIVKLALVGEVDVYELPNSVIVMELSKYPQFAVYHGFIAAGNLEEILSAHKMMFREARLRGAKYLSIAGRRGWEKAMKAHGWQHKLSIMQIEVPYEQDK